MYGNSTTETLTKLNDSIFGVDLDETKTYKQCRSLWDFYTASSQPPNIAASLVNNSFIIYFRLSSFYRRSRKELANTSDVCGFKSLQALCLP